MQLDPAGADIMHLPPGQPTIRAPRPGLRQQYPPEAGPTHMIEVAALNGLVMERAERVAIEETPGSVSTAPSGDLADHS